MIPGADEEIESMSYNRAKSMYGENLPEVFSGFDAAGAGFFVCRSRARDRS